ncbi:hypothetical protein X736_29225 [Mesorhizobium sp. L2C089B000]|nr:hypothetical protein X736_29225 [Mesorhizobium sp. L2C089B000]ESZ51691.1 hypothetical protein X731_03640 [Mesorhizobium sp. L2C054A000]
MEGFQNYVSSMDRYLGELDIKPKPIKDRDGSFARFLAGEHATSRTPDMWSATRDL